jgi:hypothetical protein
MIKTHSIKLHSSVPFKTSVLITTIINSNLKILIGFILRVFCPKRAEYLLTGGISGRIRKRKHVERWECKSTTQDFMNIKDWL